MDEKKIRRVNALVEFIEWAEQFDDGRYLYRGVSNDRYKIEASAYRRLKTNKTPARLLKVNQELIEKAKSRGHDQVNRQQLCDLELLAELQHFGAATCLIDFSRNALVALWFACQQSSKKTARNGKVFAVRSDDPARFKTVTPNLIREDIGHFFKVDEPSKYPLYQWEPKFQNNRIITQHSVFVFGGAQIEAEAECLIVLGRKQAILESLERFSDITEASMYPDFDGFARLHAHDKPFIEPDARGYLQRGIEAHKKGDLDDSIAYYNEVIRLNPTKTSILADAYYNRGVAHEQKDDYERAINDFTEAINLNPDSEKNYNGRGKVYEKRGDHERAITDFDEAINLDPKLAESYLNRAAVNRCIGEYKRVIKDYTTVINLRTNFVVGYYNRGEARLHLKEWDEGKKDLRTAVEKGADIVKEFRKEHKSIELFEERHSIQLPEDIAAMLTPDDYVSRIKELKA